MKLANVAADSLHLHLASTAAQQDELRKEALDTICSLALALGPDFAIFSSTIFKVRCAQRLLF